MFSSKVDETAHLARARRYGIAFDDYCSLLEVQAGKCAICLVERVDTLRELHLDHCHATDRVRGFLCSKCNIGLGEFQDNPEILRRAASYLEDDLGSLMDRMAEMNKVDGRLKCSVAHVLKALEGTPDHDELVEVLANSEKYPASTVSSVLREDGHTISAFSVRRHRRRECAC